MSDDAGHRFIEGHGDQNTFSADWVLLTGAGECETGALATVLPTREPPIQP